MRYIVATDGPILSGSQSARLYRAVGYRARAELAATGTVDQMQTLADELNLLNDLTTKGATDEC